MKNLSLLLSLLLLSLYGNSQGKNFIDQPYIEVVGTADSLVTPNEIFIKIIVSERDSKGKESVEELENKMLQALKRIGIQTEMNLTIDDISSNFKFYLLKQKDIFKTKEYILKVVDAKMASRVFIELQNLAISNVSIQKVSHTNMEEIKNRVRSMAVDNARQHAIALARPLNQTIGPAIYISENEGEINLLGAKVAAVSLRRSASFAAEESYFSNLDFQKITISSTVNLKFILK
jgi:uncharacterized protein YggE